MKQKIQDDLKVAMKAREQLKVTTLRGVLSEVKRLEIDTKQELQDEQVTSVIQKEVKKRREAIKFAEEAGRNEMVEQNQAEISILQEYLGQQLSAEVLREIVTKLVGEGADSIGKIMGELNKNHKGQFEGKVASDIARELLG